MSWAYPSHFSTRHLSIFRSTDCRQDSGRSKIPNEGELGWFIRRHPSETCPQRAGAFEMSSSRLPDSRSKSLVGAAAVHVIGSPSSTLMRWSFTARSSCRGFEISSICNAPITRNNRFCSLAAESGLWRPFTIPPIHPPCDSIENQGSCRPKPSLPNRHVRFRQQDQLKVSPSVRVWGGSRMRSAGRRGIIRPGR